MYEGLKKNNLIKPNLIKKDRFEKIYRKKNKKKNLWSKSRKYFI